MTRTRKQGITGTAITGLVALVGSLLASCAGVPDRTAEAETLTSALRALSAVESVDGRYYRNQSAGYAYNVDIRMSPDATAAQTRAVADRYHAGITGADFSRHTSRFALHLGDDSIRVFLSDRHPASPAAQVDRWYRLIRDVPGALEWAVTIDSGRGLGSITVKLDRPERSGDAVQLTGLAQLLAARAPDLADRQWIVHWRKLRLDLMGPQYPSAEVTKLVSGLAGTGQWSTIYDPSASPTLKLAVWADAPDLMEGTARSHLPRIATLGVPVSYTVRADRTTAVEVLLGGCLAGGSELQQRLNREFGSC
ncbi:MAG: hypothetical protein QM711_06745 [Micropruina sp.]|uniref:hypothetical protein n=1 Tax=Micropruina sp. TaxID=2737536 RepID=UPI0039E7038E